MQKGSRIEYKVAEKFTSINGEGKCAGQLAVFIRFQGCNLNCEYCDTKWANEEQAAYEVMTEQDIYTYIKSTKIKNVTLTGGEPLLQPEIGALIQKLSEDTKLRVEIETNGSVCIKEYQKIENPPEFTMDYKLPISGMTNFMCLENFLYLKKKDTVKFVVGGKSDLEMAKQVIEKYRLTEKCSVYFSPVFGRINPVKIVEFMLENQMNQVNLQLQMHKFIWEPEKRGV
ncbi:putative 7-carboxy-7-deazaguanine synthase QueE [Lachnospiraceae bacterium 48-33]|jgi:putative 7-cyano-7-deazaguanosine (preQ0) biosynthesis protein QueE, clostridial